MTIEELTAGLDLSPEQTSQLRSNLTAIQGAAFQGLADDVARAEEGSIMTAGGLDILARGIAGEQIIYTRVAVGDSMRNNTLVTPTDAQITQFTGLIHRREDIPIVDCRFAGNGTLVVQAMLQNANFENGFWVREIGLYAKIEGDANDVLYSYRNTGVLSSYTPSGQGATLINRLFNLVTVVDNATNITAILDGTLVYVSQAQLTNHINSPNPHPNIPQVKNEVEAAPYIWANNDDNQLHPISVENLTLQILGDSASQLPKLRSRVDQAETNIANLYMQLDSLTDGLEANLLIFEDFDDCKTVDLLKTKVLNTAGGPDDIYVESLEGVLVGHYYTVSDGSRSQYMRVRAVATNDGLYDVMFEEPFTKTFNLSKAYLYRTTGLILNGVLSGAGTVKETTLTPGETWKGTRSSVTETIELTTMQQNKSNFTLSGDYAFTNDGYFTLT